MAKPAGFWKASTPDEVQAAAKNLFGKTLVTHQTGPAGVVIHKLYIEQAQNVSRELYLACVMDRARGCPVMMASLQGGMEIEELARNACSRMRLLIEPVDPVAGLSAAARQQMLAQRLSLSGKARDSVAQIAQGLAKAFLQYDASLIEVNPLGLTDDGRAIAMDAKISLDDNALFRHPMPRRGVTPQKKNPLDVRASKAGVNYVALDGSIGCLVNGESQVSRWRPWT